MTEWGLLSLFLSPLYLVHFILGSLVLLATLPASQLGGLQYLYSLSVLSILLHCLNTATFRIRGFTMDSIAVTASRLVQSIRHHSA